MLNADIRPFLTPRALDTHKGHYGHVLLVGGSARKPGAILMAGRATLRSGAGLVTVALPKSAFRKLSKNFLELMYEPMPDTRAGTFSAKAIRQILALLPGKVVVALGPGMGVDKDIRSIILIMLNKSTVPVLLDADALNSLVGHVKWLRKAKVPVILTPHPGEMARLLNITTKKLQKSRLQYATQFAQEHGVYLVLKGFRTIVATPSGEIFINATGNPGMATGGMGDVLTGVIAALLAQGIKLPEAVVTAVYLHGRAGDRVAERLGDRGLLASDVIEEMPLAIKELVLSS